MLRCRENVFPIDFHSGRLSSSRDVNRCRCLTLFICGTPVRTSGHDIPRRPSAEGGCPTCSQRPAIAGETAESHPRHLRPLASGVEGARLPFSLFSFPFIGLLSANWSNALKCCCPTLCELQCMFVWLWCLSQCPVRTDSRADGEQSCVEAKAPRSWVRSEQQRSRPEPLSLFRVLLP